MRQTAFLALALSMGAGALQAQELRTPSGLDVRLYDVRLEPELDAARFRFVAEALLGAEEAQESLAEDALWLCEHLALPALNANGWSASQLVVSLSAKEVPFGSFDPDVPQFFEGFGAQTGTCEWEAF